jgi:acyl-CoA hydrolase
LRQVGLTSMAVATGRFRRQVEERQREERKVIVVIVAIGERQREILKLSQIGSGRVGWVSQVGSGWVGTERGE